MIVPLTQFVNITMKYILIIKIIDIVLPPKFFFGGGGSQPVRLPVEDGSLKH